MLRPALVSVLLAFLLLSPAAPAGAADQSRGKSSYTVSVSGVQVFTSSKHETQLWYGIRSIDGQSERTYMGTVPAGGGFVAFGGAVQYPAGYCVTWVMYTTWTGFYDAPLCTASTTAAADGPTPTATSAPAPTSSASPTATKSPTSAPATTTPSRTRATPAATTKPTARPTASPSASASAPPTESPSSSPTESPTASPTAVATDVPLPEDTVLVDRSAAEMQDALLDLTARANAASSAGSPAQTPVGFLLAGVGGLVAAATGGTLLLVRAVRR